MLFKKIMKIFVQFQIFGLVLSFGNSLVNFRNNYILCFFDLFIRGKMGNLQLLSF